MISLLLRQILVQLVDALHLQLLIAVAFDFAANLKDLRFGCQYMVQPHLGCCLALVWVILDHFGASSTLHQPLPLLDDHFLSVSFPHISCLLLAQFVQFL